MRVHDLGPLIVSDDGVEQPVTGRRGAAMLALLVVHANRRVSTDALMDAAWGETISSGAASTLESHIWRLRQVLEPRRGRREPPSVLINEAGGFRLVAAPGSVDSLLFEQRAAEVHGLAGRARYAEAESAAGAALGLWRGDPFGLLATEGWAQPFVARLVEVRDQLREQQVEALLALRQFDRALAMLRTLVAEQPFRESLRVLLMKALYATGRTEEALREYQDTRQTLLEEVGVDPSPLLNDVHRQILRNDPVDFGPAPAAPPDLASGDAAGKTTGVAVLPAVNGQLVGRESDLARVSELVTRFRSVTVVGPAGAGKTRLGVEVARTSRDVFPDGVWLVDLDAVHDSDLVGDTVVSTLGLANAWGGSPAELLRDYLRSRTALVVLDNCERLVEAVADLTAVVFSDGPASTQSCLVATSREPLGIAGEAVWRLDPLPTPPEGTELADLERYPAVELFLGRLREAAPALVLDGADLRQVHAICDAVDGLPLALELAAARARTFSLDEVAAQVQQDPSRLAALRDPSQRRSVFTTIDWSYQLLGQPERLAHRRLSVLPGPFTADLASSVVTGDAAHDVDAVDPAEVATILSSLVDRSLLVPMPHNGGPTTFRQLATVRGHAQRVLEDRQDLDAPADRRDAWVSQLLARRPPLGSLAEPSWYARIDSSLGSVRATLTRRLLDQPDAEGAALPHRLQFYWFYRQQLVEGGRWLELAKRVLSETGDPVDLLSTRIALAASWAVQGRSDQLRAEAETILGDWPDLVAAVPPDRLVTLGEGFAGLVAAAWVPDSFDLVDALHARLREVSQHTGDGNLDLLTAACGCVATFAAGRTREAAEQAVEVYRRAEQQQNLMAGWLAAGSPALDALLHADPNRGLPWLERMSRNQSRLGFGINGSFLEMRANFAVQQGRFADAVGWYARAHLHTRRANMAWPRRPVSAQLMELAREYVGPDTFTALWDAAVAAARTHEP